MNDHATTQLKIALEIARNNLPINLREGKFAQARLEGSVIHDCRQALSLLQRSKSASFPFRDPGAADYARIGGRTALEGAGGGYGAGALTALLLGLLAKKFPGVISSGAARGLTAGMAGAGAVAGGSHGFDAAVDNTRRRLNPLLELQHRLFGS